MRIIFTDKLSKMVAHYENLRDMYDIWIEHIFWHKYQLRLWRGKYSVSWTRPTGRKNLECNSKRYQQPWWASGWQLPNLMKNKTIDKLEEFRSERKTYSKTKMVGNIMSIRQKNVHYMVPLFEQLGHSYI